MQPNYVRSTRRCPIKGASPWAAPPFNKVGTRADAEPRSMTTLVDELDGLTPSEPLSAADLSYKACGLLPVNFPTIV